MDNRITKLSRNPFYAAATSGISLVVDSATGDIFMGSPVLRARKGLVFSLIAGDAGHLLRLQYVDITIDVGWTDDVEDAATWVEAVNRFLATKRDVVPPNGRVVPQAPAESAFG
jgi:hypothetical protein